MTQKYWNKKADEEIMSYIRANLNKIKVKPGVCRFNFRCHNNAVHDAIMDKEFRIAMVFYTGLSQPIIHFVNVNKKGEFTDNTLGVWSDRYDYYLIKYIEREDLFKTLDIFEDYRKWIRTQLSFWTKLFSTKTNF